MSLVYNKKTKNKKRMKRTLHSSLVYNNTTSQQEREKKKGMRRTLVYSNNPTINTSIR